MTASLPRLVWSPSAILWCLSSLGDNTPRIMHTTGGINHAETDRPATPILVHLGATKKVTGAQWAEGTIAVMTVPSARRLPALSDGIPSSLGPWPFNTTVTGSPAETVTRSPRTDS